MPFTAKHSEDVEYDQKEDVWVRLRRRAYECAACKTVLTVLDEGFYYCLGCDRTWTAGSTPPQLRPIRFTVPDGLMADPPATFVAYNNEVWIAEQLYDRLDHELTLRLDDDIPDVVVDIGAHVGFYSILVARMGAKRVFAFEPSPVNYPRLVANIERNGMVGRVLPFPFAVGSAWGSADLRVPVEFKGVSNPDRSIVERLMTSTMQVNLGQASLLYKTDKAVLATVPIVPLASVLRLATGAARAGSGRFVDLLKIDVEGGEYPMLLESEAAVLHPVRLVDMEVHDLQDPTYFGPSEWKVEHIHNKMLSAGFESQKSLHGGTWWVRKAQEVLGR